MNEPLNKAVIWAIRLAIFAVLAAVVLVVA